MSGSKFKKQRRTKDKTVDLDITSLLDIITILLVFLLQSYNVTDLKLDLVANLEIVDSNAKTLGANAVIVQITKGRSIYIENKHLGDVTESGDDKIEFLYQALTEYKKQNENKPHMGFEIRKLASSDSTLPSDKEENLKARANLVFDKGLPYKVVRKVMHTTALAGYNEFKFIVQSAGE